MQLKYDWTRIAETISIAIVQLKSTLGGSARALVATRLHEEEKPELVENVGGGFFTWLVGHVAWPPGHLLAPN
jgi:hypothetical protein